MNLDYILRFLIILGIAGGGIVWVFYWFKVNKSKRNYAIAPILFVINSLIYMVLSLVNLLSKELYLLWGDIVSLQGLVLLITIGILLIQLFEGGKK